VNTSDRALDLGQTAKLEILRNGEKRDVEVTVAIVRQPELDAGSINPPHRSYASDSSPRPQAGRRHSAAVFGKAVQRLSRRDPEGTTNFAPTASAPW
jgi:hypothetical protein